MILCNMPSWMQIMDFNVYGVSLALRCLLGDIGEKRSDGMLLNSVSPRFPLHTSMNDTPWYHVAIMLVLCLLMLFYAVRANVHTHVACVASGS